MQLAFQVASKCVFGNTTFFS
uniref:Uncharacterized protein n=1 Tax=Arundo donax TaxID=35708 RepID=A0A0A9FK19_ARUDO